MNREIKFRGLTEKKEWRYGFLIETLTSTHILDAGGLPLARNQVHPETVGQFTGLKDKNGVEIYEGDIVQDTLEAITGLDTSHGEIAVVSWAGHDEKTGWLPWADVMMYAGRPPFSEPTKSVAVIGNIYENPELLESQE